MADDKRSWLRLDRASDEYEHRTGVCWDFCRHIPTGLMEDLLGERVGAATFMQWVRRNPKWIEDTVDGVDVCIQCHHVCSSSLSQHAEDCLLDRSLKLMKGRI